MSELEEFRKMKDDFFKHDAQSPLTREQKKTFTGLNYYPENEALRFVLELEPYPDPEKITMQTSKGEVRDYLKVGQFRFPVDGQEVTLQVYESEDDPGEYFVPFVDATAPKETYGAGRYLEPEKIGPNKFLLDFNVAYNPYCAFDPRKWSCPLPPPENRLKVRIEAGEKNFEDHDTL
ncbi:MAG TPA: DUF1684 domain-containing protein [Anaerolineae bacterium]|nr:DUF1684 domain-containing protein [Anaerolineae bacterium]